MYEDLRARYGAVAPVLVPGDRPAWLVLGYQENLEVMRAPSRFSADSRLWNDMEAGLIGLDHPLTPVTMWQPLVNFAEGEDQRRLRGAVNDSLARFNQIGIRRRITRIAHGLLDEFCSKGHADLVPEFTQRLPMLSMMRLLGVPEDDAPQLIAACQDLLAGTETAAASNAYVMEVLTELVITKKARPENDLPSFLIQHEAKLSDQEVAEHLRHTLVAAHTTTSNLLADTITFTLTDDRARAQLHGGGVTLQSAIHHMLWERPPIAVLPARYAVGDTQLKDQPIKKGDMVLLGLAAGNADPAVRLDHSLLMEGNRSHLAFSGGGHECPGQDIGIAIVDTAIDILLSRLPDLRLADSEGELPRIANWMGHPLVSLPVEFTRRKPQTEPTISAAPAAGETTQSSPLPAFDLAPVPSPAPVATTGPSRREGRWSRLIRLLRGR
jgi:cytochrome P450